MRGLLFEFLDPYANKFAKPLPIIGVRATLINVALTSIIVGWQFFAAFYWHSLCLVVGDWLIS